MYCVPMKCLNSTDFSHRLVVFSTSLMLMAGVKYIVSVSLPTECSKDTLIIHFECTGQNKKKVKEFRGTDKKKEKEIKV